MSLNAYFQFDETVISTMRTELSRESMVTGRRYGEQPDLTDRYG